jgi:hypothetical protein
VGQRLERDRPHRLPEQPPALLDLVGRDVVQAHELGVLLVVPAERGLHPLEHGVLLPGLPRRPRLRHLGEPQLEPLVLRIGGEQPVQRGRPRPRQAGDEDRPLDRDVGVLRMLRPLRHAEQPRDQRAAQERPLDGVALRREPGVPVVGLEHDLETFDVVVAAEVLEPGEARGRGVQVLDRADVVAFPGHAAPVSGGTRRC